MKDTLGDKIKSFEVRETSRLFLPNVPIVVRLDGRSFHSFTKGMARPYDSDFNDLMDSVSESLVKEFNLKCAYDQSDEISAILYSDNPESELPFNGKCFKLISTLASYTTSVFVQGAIKKWPDKVAKHNPGFDCRIFEVPTKEIAVDALRWRETDATKNAISMAAQHYFSHKVLQGKSSKEMQEMLFQDFGINFNDYPARFKRGAYFQRKSFATMLDEETLLKIPEKNRPTGPVTRSKVVALNLPRINSVTNIVDVIFDGVEPVVEK